MRRAYRLLILGLVVSLSPTAKCLATGQPDSTTQEITAIAQRLLGGRRPNAAIMIESPSGDVYLASIQSNAVHLYSRKQGQEFSEIWKNAAGSMESIDHLKFVTFKDEPGVSLAFLVSWAGNGPRDDCVNLYSVSKRKILFIRYSEQGNPNSTGKPQITADETNASDYPEIRSWLESYAHQLGIDGATANAPDALSTMEDEWLKANLRSTGQIKLHYLSSISSESSKVATLDDNRYIWTSYFKSGVVGFDKQKSLYFMAYVPADKYEWIQELHLVYPWLYMKPANGPDGHGHWAIRFDVESSTLERGNFDLIVAPEQAAETGPRTPAVERNSQLVRQSADRKPDLAAAPLLVFWIACLLLSTVGALRFRKRWYFAVPLGIVAALCLGLTCVNWTAVFNPERYRAELIAASEDTDEFRDSEAEILVYMAFGGQSTIKIEKCESRPAESKDKYVRVVSCEAKFLVDGQLKTVPVKFLADIKAPKLTPYDDITGLLLFPKK